MTHAIERLKRHTYLTDLPTESESIGTPIQDFNRGRWNGEEMKILEQCVRKELRSKFYEGKVTSLDAINTEDGKRVRDFLPWAKIQPSVGTRSYNSCTSKWYNSLAPNSVRISNSWVAMS